LFEVILVTFGLLWPSLKLSAVTSRIAFWFLVYSGFAIIAAFIIGAIWEQVDR